MAKPNQAREAKGMLTLFLGPFQPELEEAFFLWVRRKKEKDPFAPLIVLVGSNLLGLYLRRLLAQRGLNHINLRFLTFIDLARTLAAEPLDRKGLRPLPRYGDFVLISSSSALRYFFFLVHHRWNAGPARRGQLPYLKGAFAPNVR